jgi:hypothetical protein
MFDFDSFHREMVQQTVLCVGDLMLDEFVYGEVSRISPEAPAPVIAARRSEISIGGAGNVARNIACRGCKAADDAQGALRVRTFPHPHAARRLGNGRSGAWRD